MEELLYVLVLARCGKMICMKSPFDIPSGTFSTQFPVSGHE